MLHPDHTWNMRRDLAGFVPFTQQSTAVKWVQPLLNPASESIVGLTINGLSILVLLVE